MLLSILGTGSMYPTGPPCSVCVWVWVWVWVWVCMHTYSVASF